MISSRRILKECGQEGLVMSDVGVGDVIWAVGRLTTMWVAHGTQVRA